MMETLVEWLNSEKETHPVLVSGISQFQLVHVHPFRDGNGRASRLLSTLCLYRAGYDFKRLFTISEYYDRDRAAFYSAIQDVREQDMDMTRWLEYFVEGLATQMQEMVERGKGAMRNDLIVKQYELKERQAKALRFFLENDEMHMRDMEALCPKVNRRTLQRDLQQMEALGIIRRKGVARKSYYVLE